MKNGIKYLVAGLVATGITMSSYAAGITVNWATSQNTFIADNTGSLNYLSGDLIEVGAFTSGPTIGSSSLANFVVFGTTLSATGLGAGSFSASHNGSDVGFAHTQIYLVAFNNATGIGATQEGIYFVNDANNANWKFPAASDTITTTTFDLQDLFTNGTTAQPAAGATVVFGSTGVDTSGPSNMVELKVVPEPSTWMLVGTGLLGLLGLRRRRS